MHIATFTIPFIINVNKMVNEIQMALTNTRDNTQYKNISKKSYSKSSEQILRLLPVII